MSQRYKYDPDNMPFELTDIEVNSFYLPYKALGSAPDALWARKERTTSYFVCEYDENGNRKIYPRPYDAPV